MKERGGRGGCQEILVILDLEIGNYHQLKILTYVTSSQYINRFLDYNVLYKLLDGNIHISKKLCPMLLLVLLSVVNITNFFAGWVCRRSN